MLVMYSCVHLLDYHILKQTVHICRSKGLGLICKLVCLWAKANSKVIMVTHIIQPFGFGSAPDNAPCLVGSSFLYLLRVLLQHLLLLLCNNLTITGLVSAVKQNLLKVTENWQMYMPESPE